MHEYERIMLETSYVNKKKGETAEDVYVRVAKAGSDNPEHEKRLLSYFKNNWARASSPITSNLGTDSGLPISCFIQEPADNLPSIFSKYYEAMSLSAAGGGVGVDYSAIRELGSTTKSGQTAGVVPFLKINEAIASGISQGSVRRGSVAAYLNIHHPEIQEFIELRKLQGASAKRRAPEIHHGVVLTDEFMQSVVRGTDYALYSPKGNNEVARLDAFNVFRSILETRLGHGEPYIVFSGNVNKDLKQEYVKAGMSIKNSNLCVTGDTKILTQKYGNIAISEVAGQELNCWNGQKWSRTRIFQTSLGDFVISVKLTNGTEIKATAKHKWYVNTAKSVGDVIKRTYQLCAGDVISSFELPLEDGSTELYEDIRVLGLELVGGGVFPTFCGTEYEEHKLVFNGILTGNCSEIFLPTSPDYTAVCCLASVNIQKFKEWEGNYQFIEDIMRLLDNVMLEFVKKARSGLYGDPKGFEDAIRSVEFENSVGLGVMGLHTYLQDNLIPFESAIAEGFQRKVFSFLKASTDKASKEIAKEKGACPMSIYNGDGQERFTCKMSIAPTASISILCGMVSAGIDPIPANIYIHENKTGKHIIRNESLEKFITEFAKSNGKPKGWVEKQWSLISEAGGSVLELEWMSKDVKDVFKTAFELDQRWVIYHAAARQEYIDQGQSINLFIPPNIDLTILTFYHVLAWKLGLKSLYYLRSKSIKRASTTSDREIIEELTYDTCLSCQ